MVCFLVFCCLHFLFTTGGKFETDRIWLFVCLDRPGAALDFCPGGQVTGAVVYS